MDVFALPLRPLAVVPVLVGPMQALLALLPAILVAIGGTLVAMFKPSAIKRFARLLWAQKLPVALVVAGVIALAYAYGAVFPPRVEEVSAAAAGDVEWTLWRGGPERRGALPGSKDPVRGKVNWVFAADDVKTFYASPAVVGNRVYITSARYEYFKDAGAISSVDADSGRCVWTFKADRYRATFSSPAVKGKYLVVGEGLHFTNDARVFCIDIERSEQERRGVKLWDYRTKSHVESSPCIADGRAYIGAGDDGFYCFALDPAPDGTARVLWHLDGKEYPDCETSPVVADGRVYFGLGMGGQAVCCVDAETGKKIWRLETPCPVFSSPSVADGKLYFGMGFGDFVNRAEAVAQNMRDRLGKEGKSDAEIEEAVRHIRPRGEVWCVDLAGYERLRDTAASPISSAAEEIAGARRLAEAILPEVDWKFPVARTVLGAVAVDGNRLYFGSRDGHLYCVSTEGKLIRKWNATDPIVTSPAVGEKHVYVTTTTDTSGGLHGLNKTTMEPVWEVWLGSPGFSSPTVARGHIYVGTTASGLLSAGEPGETEEKPLWRGPLGGAGRLAWRDGSLIPARGSYGWAGSVGENNPSAKITQSRTPPAYLDGAFYVGLEEDGARHQERPGSTGGPALRAFGLVRLNRAEKLSGKPTRAWFARSKNPVSLSAAAGEGAVFFVDGRPGDEGRALRCLDPEGGEERWRHAVGTGGSGAFAITRDRLLIADEAEMLTCLDIATPSEKAIGSRRDPAAARVLWKAKVGPCVGVPVHVADMVVVAVKSPPHLAALDSATGLPLWRETLPAEPQTGPIHTAGRVWVGLPEGLFGASLLSGEESLSVTCGPVTGTLVCDDTRLVCTTGALKGQAVPGGELVVIDPDTGAETARIRDVLPERPGRLLSQAVPGSWSSVPPILAGDALLYLKEGSVQRYDFGSGESTRWAQIRPSWPGNLLTPMIMVDSHVFFATDKRGFICMKPKR